jgi:hypothetical protein
MGALNLSIALLQLVISPRIRLLDELFKGGNMLAFLLELELHYVEE